uniref:PH-interacting protein n=1 Tax=Tanacetum cinerariifolium TaxID=118510 RepID=A0A6L2KXW8_TANCI|nr:PH-interacting protein [Tanacetum cinerariifolium]
MALHKNIPPSEPRTGSLKALSLSSKVKERAPIVDVNRRGNETGADIDLREVYFLIMHFLSAGPCHRTYGQFWNELLEHQLLPRRYHSWYSRSGITTGDENDDGMSFPLSYNKLVERYPHIEKDHLVKLLKQLLSGAASSSQALIGHAPANAAAVPTLLGTGSFSLLSDDVKKGDNQVRRPPGYMRWPHMQADQVRGLGLREIGGGFSRHHRAPSVRAASYAIVKPSTVVQKMENLKRLRGHRNAVYCAIFDRLGRYVITGSDDRLVKIWSMETAYCLASCRGHEGDITDLAVSFNNALVASASNDCIIRVWRIADGLPISVLRGHTGAVTAIAFSPRLGSVYQLLSSSDDGSCRIWDARHSQFSPRIYIPKPPEPQAGKSNGPSSSSFVPQSHQIFCCAFNSSGTVFVTGSSDTLARVWNACKPNNDDPEQPNHEMDVLAGHENDVNYVQFSGCAVASKISSSDASKEENIPKFKNTWFTHDNIVTCSRDGSAIIWVPKSRRSHGRIGRWTRAYHLKVPPPPMPPQQPRGGPRQRILPTPRGVNMIVWSLDNRFVLAAIMDCRICVWNAVDGSLVHSLTGHSESTYVLDVHPFNPRIAMSAGYDGKTIVWDIWEGVPIRIFEIGRFKLVDGKFSPDGTSIVLSDEVGQLYILSTGQGEAQNDAKYDQFFLGDYRPLIQDAHGNVLDQETQLAPYRRNMQDLLCDSGMIPYPEPYQSLYQQRRLGSLGFEWRPSSVRFAVGTDISLVDQEYQVPPIADLDILMDPLPEFLDAMDWEPEIEVHSDDNDSEYNVTEECHSAGEQGSLSSNASASIECSGGDSEDQISRDDTSRKSKTKKIKAEADFMTSSGRRVKRRNLDGEESSLRDDLSRKSRFGKKPSMKKSSRSKVSRPRRAAARNALSFLSRISGKASDEEEDVLEGNSSQSYSSEQETEAGSEETEVSSENEENGHLKGKEIVSEDISSHQDNPKRRLVFKLPNRDTSKRELVGPSSTTPPHDIDESSKNFSSINGDGDFVERKENFGSPMKYMNHVSLLEGSIKWGGAKSRSIKRPRITEPIMSVARSLDESCTDGSYNIENVVNEKPPIEKEEFSPSDDEIQKGKMVQLNEKQEKNQDKELPIPLQKKLRTPTKLKIRSSVQESRNGDGIMISDGSTSDVPNGKISRMPLNGAWDCKTISSDIQGSQEPDSRDKMFKKVYSRSKSTRSRTSVSMNGGGMEASTSNANSINQDEATEPRIHGTRRNMNLRVIHEVSEDTSSREKSSSDGDDELPQEEDRLNSRHKVGLRSTRNRRAIDYNRRDISLEKKKQHQSTRSSWLLLATHEEGSRYIPQLGDEVVYFRQGHQDYISGSNSREIGPWTKGNIRDVEFCKVKDLEYATHPGSGEGCCKMTLQFEDPSSNVVGKTFKLTLREVTGFPDFLVERSRYDAAMKRDWRCRDKCQVWWKNEDEENGNWWDGRIVAVKPKSDDFPDSPWERYSVQYKGDPIALPHSPWELYDPNASMVWEEPHIDDDIRTKLIRALAKLEKSGKKSGDHYGIHKLRQVSQSTTFVNKFPVPLTLDVIQSRLENNYYRRFAAMKHDVEVLLQNAEAYFGRNKDFSMKMRRLSDWFTRTLSL